MPDKQQTGTGPLQKLEAICEEIFQRWDKDQRSGKLLSALAGHLPRYRADVTEVREALQDHSDMKAALEKCQKTLALLIDPKANRNISGAGVINAFAICTEAEATARAALSKLEGGK